MYKCQTLFLLHYLRSTGPVAHSLHREQYASLELFLHSHGILPEAVWRHPLQRIRLVQNGILVLSRGLALAQ